jgi:hypothetical protein
MDVDDTQRISGNDLGTHDRPVARQDHQRYLSVSKGG